MRRFLIAGNWKMNNTLESSQVLAKALVAGVSAATDSVEIVVCPPHVYLNAVSASLSKSSIELGAQNAYFAPEGAFTGETSLGMLKDVGCRYVILGHSERRHVLGESNELTNQKVVAAIDITLNVIFCVGETLDERQSGEYKAVLDVQMEKGLAGLDEQSLDNMVIAYEPVWAIGTGETATPEQAELVHKHLRNWLSSRYNSSVAENTRIVYGGSVNPKNARSLLEQPNVDGALVGGASLKADAFLPIVQAAVELAGR